MNSTYPKHHQLIIVGGGVAGAALCYTLSRYTNIKSILLLEKYEDFGTLNTKATSNSQTIHFGDIETNYTVAKACITKRAAKMVERYCLQHGYENDIIFSHQKMALGVGEHEVEFMLERFEEFSELFPRLEVWDKNRLKEIEPKVVFDFYGNERKEDIVGVGSQNEWTTVNFGKMARSLLQNAHKDSFAKIETKTHAEVLDITPKQSGGYLLKTQDENFTADFVIVNAGAHSLYLAHRMGYGLDYGCLPVAGSFYMTTEKILKGKVYMVQNPKLPFAALHGDPDILTDGYTRFGPTALLLPKLERYKPGTYRDFWKTLRFDSSVASALGNLFKDSDIRRYIFKNLLFEVPLLNKALFLNDARKIVPSLQAEQIRYASGFGGVRPQVINKKERKLMLGEATIHPEKNLIFNMTPSPGATSSLHNAERDMQKVVDYLGLNYDSDRFKKELVEYDSCPLPEPIMQQKRYAHSIREALHAKEAEAQAVLNDGSFTPADWEEPYSPWKTTRQHWSL